MGTRNLTMIVLDGKLVLSQYAQWDGYPSGQGSDVLQFLRKNKKKMDKFISNVRQLKPLNDDQLKSLGENWSSTHPQLSRDVGADILNFIMNREGLEIHIDDSFMYDSLFCEWAYLIDLDNNVLEVYQGFNETPLVEGVDRFWIANDDPKLKNKVNPDNEYQPIKLLKAYPLDKLPTVNKFVKELDKLADCD